MRKGITVTVNPSDRARLEAVVANRNSPQKHVWRCRIVLLTADDLGTAAMMLSLDGFHNSSAVILWSGLCPLGALVFCELRPAASWLLAFLALTASSVFHDPSMVIVDPT